jgi:hypothetical protein
MYLCHGVVDRPLVRERFVRQAEIGTFQRFSMLYFVPRAEETVRRNARFCQKRTRELILAMDADEVRNPRERVEEDAAEADLTEEKVYE